MFLSETLIGEQINNASGGPLWGYRWINASSLESDAFIVTTFTFMGKNGQHNSKNIRCSCCTLVTGIQLLPPPKLLHDHTFLSVTGLH